VFIQWKKKPDAHTQSSPGANVEGVNGENGACAHTKGNDEMWLFWRK